MKTIILFSALACGAMLAACSSNNNTPTAPTQPTPIVFSMTATIGGHAWVADSMTSAGNTTSGGTYYTVVSGTAKNDSGTISFELPYTYNTISGAPMYDSTTTWQLTNGIVINIPGHSGTYFAHGLNIYIGANVVSDTILQGTFQGTYYTKATPPDSVVLSTATFKVHGKLHL